MHVEADLVRDRLEGLIRQNRAELFEPWQALLATSPDLQAEMDATVQALQVFFNKWVVEIILVLGRGEPVRFNDLKRSLEGISGRTLSQRLRDLEEQGLVHRTLYDEMPVRVEYRLTEKGLDVASLALPLVLYLRLDTPAGAGAARGR